MRSCTSRIAIVFVALVLGFGAAGPAAAAPEGTMTWGVHITLASRWLDPGETEGIATPFMVLHQIQQILHDRVTHIPIYELAFIWGVGPRVEEPGINLIRSFAYSGPLEDVKLKRP